MSYEPTVWKDGDLVTSAKLNKLEQGVANGGGILVVHEDENGRLDRTWHEIYNADFVIISHIDEYQKSNAYAESILFANNKYNIQTSNLRAYTASTPNDYPVYNEGGLDK